jgi:hypothetical protein
VCARAEEKKCNTSPIEEIMDTPWTTTPTAPPTAPKLIKIEEEKCYTSARKIMDTSWTTTPTAPKLQVLSTS